MQRWPIDLTRAQQLGESAIFTLPERMSNKLCLDGGSAGAFGYNRVTCAWFEHAINGQVGSAISAFYNCHQVRSSKQIALKSQSSIDSDRCARLVQPGAKHPLTALAAVRLDGAYAAVPVLFIAQERVCHVRWRHVGSGQAAGGQVAPDVKTNRACAARYAVPVDTRVGRIFERRLLSRGKP